MSVFSYLSAFFASLRQVTAKRCKRLQISLANWMGPLCKEYNMASSKMFGDENLSPLDSALRSLLCFETVG